MMRAESAVAVPPAADTTPLVLAGRSAAVTALRADIDAALDATCVLLEAEPGLDVADIARDVHARRSDGPFLLVDCAAAEPARIERELFGDKRRTHVDDDLDVVDTGSAIARAHGGTLYLHDVADLSAAAQARLARLVRDREAVIDGSTRRIDVTLVGSMLVAPDGEDGSRLRRDLQKHFERARVTVPPLRRRADDIPLLVEQLIATLCRKDRPAPPPVTHPAMTLLAAMPWKGNLVELRHAVSRLTAGAAGGVIQLEDVLTHVRFDGTLAPPVPAGTLRAARQQFERDYIALVIRHHRGHIGDAARALGIQRTNLYRKARQLGIAVARVSR